MQEDVQLSEKNFIALQEPRWRIIKSEWDIECVKKGGGMERKEREGTNVPFKIIFVPVNALWQ